MFMYMHVRDVTLLILRSITIFAMSNYSFKTSDVMMDSKQKLRLATELQIQKKERRTAGCKMKQIEKTHMNIYPVMDA